MLTNAMERDATDRSTEIPRLPGLSPDPVSIHNIPFIRRFLVYMLTRPKAEKPQSLRDRA